MHLHVCWLNDGSLWGNWCWTYNSLPFHKSQEQGAKKGPGMGNEIIFILSNSTYKCTLCRQLNTKCTNISQGGHSFLKTWFHCPFLVHPQSFNPHFSHITHTTVPYLLNIYLQQLTHMSTTPQVAIRICASYNNPVIHIHNRCQGPMHAT